MWGFCEPVYVTCTIANLQQMVVFIILLKLMGTNPLLGVSIILEARTVLLSSQCKYYTVYRKAVVLQSC